MNRFAQFFTSWFHRPVIEQEDVTPARKYGRRTLPTRVSQDQFTEAFVSQIARLPIRSKQLLMLDLYADQNLFLERFIDFLVNPIVGKRGFVVDVDIDSPETKKVFTRFLTFNRMTKSRTFRRLVTDYLLTGEICLLKVPKPTRDTYQLVRVPAPVIRQTIVDPGNYNEVIAVEQEYGQQQTLMHRVICDEDLLTAEGRRARSKLKFDCYLFQNVKRGYPTLSPYAQNDLFRKYEIRGEPYLTTSADLLQALVSYLWKTLDKMDSWNIFNYKFNVETSATEPKDVQKELDEWADAIGKPEPNSAIFLPNGIMSMEPVTFPMHSADLGQFYRMVRNATAWHAGTKETAMGEGEVRYASNQLPGVTEPSVETKEVLQQDQIDFLIEMLEDIGKEAFNEGRIPKEELTEDDPVTFNFSIAANEISKASQEGPTSALEKFVNTTSKMQEMGAATQESINNAISQKGKELLNVEFVPPEQDDEVSEVETESEAQQQEDFFITQEQPQNQEETERSFEGETA